MGMSSQKVAGGFRPSGTKDNPTNMNVFHEHNFLAATSHLNQTVHFYHIKDTNTASYRRPVEFTYLFFIV